LDRNLQLAAALVIALVALGGNFFVLLTENSQIDQNKSALSSQITVLQDSLGALQTTVNTLRNQLSLSQQAQSAQAQQVSALQGNLQDVQSQLANVIKEFNSNRSSDLAFQGQIYSQLQGISTTLQTLTGKLNALTPQVPLSTLVVIGDTYNNATNTFTLNVQNTLNLTVYAQISAVLYGTSSQDCNQVAGSYISQVLTFLPKSMTVTQLSLASGVYDGCASNPVTSLSLSYIAAQSTEVSLTYTFNIVPGYNHP
jgi:hypothetical protein